MYEVSVVHHISYGPLVLDNQKVDEIHSVLLEKCKCAIVLHNSLNILLYVNK